MPTNSPVEISQGTLGNVALVPRWCIDIPDDLFVAVRILTAALGLVALFGTKQLALLAVTFAYSKTVNKA